MSPASRNGAEITARRVEVEALTLGKIVKLLNGDVITGEKLLDNSISMVGASDLMSDVLAFMKPNALLLTGLKNPQVVRTAEMADLRAICFVRGKHPEPQTIELARAKQIPLIKTQLPMFVTCGLLYAAGMKSCF